MNWQINVISVQILTERKTPLPVILKNEEVVKGVTTECTQKEPLKIHELDEGMLILVFGQGVDVTVVCDQLVALYSWLESPVEIRCDMATAEQTRQILE